MLVVDTPYFVHISFFASSQASGPSVLFFLLGGGLLFLALKVFFSVPSERRRQEEEIVRKRQEINELKRDVECAQKIAEESKREADAKWSYRARQIEREINAQFDEKVSNAVSYEKYRLAQREAEIEQKIAEKENQITQREQSVKNESRAIRAFLSKARKASPVWLANAIADYEQLRYDTEYVSSPWKTVRDYLKARRAVDRTRREESYRARYLCDYYEWLLPDLKELKEQSAGVGTYAGDDGDREDGWWLQDSEYYRLTPAQRGQLTLERYVAGGKTNWQVGRDYELYVGHVYRGRGYSVQQFGIARRLEDMGRDLICTKGCETLIVQCKFWAQSRIVREKHIAQLFGTTVAYAIENRLPVDSVLNPEQSIIKCRPVFVTSAPFSDVAVRFAKALGVELVVIDFDPKTDFPRIKCNANGERIYHLPTDQMYDRTIVDLEHGDMYATTVMEAESSGFRRAMRWTGGRQ